MSIHDNEASGNAIDLAAGRLVELGNQLLEQDPEADPWDIADGLLAGAIHYWMYTRQPCEDPMCEECAPVSSAELRMQTLLEQVKQMAVSSDYYHSPNDLTIGRA